MTQPLLYTVGGDALVEQEQDRDLAVMLKSLGLGAMYNEDGTIKSLHLNFDQENMYFPLDAAMVKELITLLRDYAPKMEGMAQVGKG